MRADPGTRVQGRTEVFRPKWRNCDIRVTWARSAEPSQEAGAAHPARGG
ncbi:hypothetical protein RKD19_006438 [Streptomyces canus]